MSRKQIIFDTLHDLVANFLYYDRKESDELPLGAIEEAVEVGEVSVDEIVDRFRRLLRDEGKLR